VPDRERFERDLRGFVERLAEKPVRVNSPLFEREFLDSLKVLDLISFIEEKLQIKIHDEEITLDNFRTIRVIRDAFFDRP
jgi:acyl carrier protein